MNKVYRNIMRIFSSITLVLLSLLFIHKVVIAVEENVTLAPTSVEFQDASGNTIDNKISIDSSSTKVTLRIKITGQAGRYNFYLETQDGTLLNALDEYTQIKSSSIYTTVELYEDNQVGYANVTLDVKDKAKNYIGIDGTPNYYYVNLVRINNTYYNKQVEVDCYTTYTYKTTTTKYDAGQILSVYNQAMNRETLIDDSKHTDNGRGSVTTLSIHLSSSYDAQTQALISNKLANYYVSTEGKIAWNDTSNSNLGLIEAKLYDTNNTTNNVLNTTTYCLNTRYSFDYAMPGTNAAYGDGNNWKYDDAILNKYIYTDNSDNWSDHTYVTKNGNAKYYFASTNQGRTYYQIDNSSNSDPYLTLTNYSGCILYKNYTATLGSLDYKKTDWKGQTINYRFDDNRKMDTKSWYAESFIADTVCPYVTNAYVINGTTTYKRNDKIQIAVRFSEPIQVLDENNLSITLTTNSFNANANKLKFKYAQGSGTYTLIFEADASGYEGQNVNISSISQIEFSNKELIRDFSSNRYTGRNSVDKTSNTDQTEYTKCGYLQSDTYSTSIAYNVDTRTPSVTITPNTKLLSSEKDITVEFRNVSDNATFYYKFISEDDLKNYNDEDFDKDLLELDTTSNHIINDSDKTGRYYMYYKVVTYYGIEVTNKSELQDDSKKSDYELLYDNSAPEILDYNTTVIGKDKDGKEITSRQDYFIVESTSDHKSHTFKVRLKDLEEIYTNPLKLGNFSHISSIYFIYSESEFKFNSNVGRICLYDSNSSTSKITYDKAEEYLYSFSISYDDLSDQIIDKTLGYVDLYVGIEIEDECGNVYSYDNEAFATANVKFDSRTNLDGSETLPSESNKIYGLDIYKKGSTVSYTIADTVTINDGSSYSAIVYKYSYDKSTNKTVKTDVSDDTNIVEWSVDVNNNRILTITFKSSGYYEYLFVLDDNIYSLSNKIYIGSDIENNEASDSTYNANNSDVVINNVWSTNSLMYYYHNGTKGASERYNLTSNSQMFSSSSYLSQYIKYYEYQDFYIIVTDSAIATSLNSSSSQTYQKASGETTTATSNQLWIRYKKAGWNYTTNSSDWVYYYYGQYDGTNNYINVLNISTNLKNAINTVVSSIVSKCSNVNLVTDEYLQNGVPYLASNQVHPNKEVANTSKCSTELRNATFTGDDGIYSSYVTITDKETGITNNFYYFSNYSFVYTPYTKLYYRMYGNSSTTNLTELDLSSKETLNQILDTGEYELIEIDEFGISRTLMYIVNYQDAPSINIEYSTKSESNTKTSYAYKNNGERFNVTSFTITSLGESLDKYAYVRVTHGNVVDTYYYSDFLDGDNLDSEGNPIYINPVYLTDGSYTIYVSDRFGNSYSFTVSVNSDDIKYTFASYDSEYVRFTSELEESDVFEFSISLNGEVISNQYSNNLKFNASGTYVLYLEDIYGNVVNETLVLERKNPEVNWYYVSGNSYQEFNEDSTSGAIIKKLGASAYEIYSSSRLQFTYTGNYSYEFSDGVNYSESSYWGTQRVSIVSEEYFTVKIYYTDYTEASVTYTVIFDSESPNISGTVSSHTYTYNDLEKIKNNDFNIEDINYVINSDDTYGIINGGEVYSKNITITLTDDSGIYSINLYKDNVLQTLSDEVISQINNRDKSITFNINSDNSSKDKYSNLGSYTIIVTDILGNESTYTFKNVEPSYVGYSVDDERVLINSDASESVEKYSYGHDSIVYNFKDISSIVYLIDNNYFTLTINNNALYLVRYINGYQITTKLTDIESSSYTKIDQSLFDDADTTLVIDGIELYFKLYKEDYYFMIKATSSLVHSINARALSDYSYNPFYMNVELCGKESNLDFINSDNSTISISDFDGFTNQSFTINNEESVFDTDITKIEYGTNSTNNFDNVKFTTLDLTKAFATFGENDSYYKFIVYNKYGQVTSYIIRVSRQLLIEIDLTYKDSFKISYTYESNHTYYTNKEASIRSYELSSVYTVYKDNQLYNIESTKSNEHVDLTLNEIGTYLVEIKDSSNNIRNLTIDIRDYEYTVSDDILTGFNEKALRRDELYTNSLITIDSSLFSSYQIYYITMSFDNGKDILLYDNISQDKTTNIDLNNYIGILGDGIYTIKFRNNYGSIVTKVVNYSSESTLSIDRMTRSELTYSTYPLDQLDGGIYSNNKFKFTSTSTKYEFRVDGNKVDCPYEISFPQSSNVGNYSYSIYYVDEYGFEYNFTANLIRQSVSYTLSTTPLEVNGVNTINKNFSILFDSDDFVGVYTLNNESYYYENNSLITKDGTYVFIITDKAGNVNTFTLVKDTIVSFSAYESSTNRTIINGDVSNNGNVVISNSDSDYVNVVKAYLNSVERETSNSYNDNGKWELLLEDQVGNQTYFTFYIYTHTISKLSYETPYNYKISKILFTDLSGNSVNYMDKVIDNDYNCAITFEENGDYYVEMLSNATNETVSFEISISNLAPDVKLVGVENNGSTNQNVTLTGYQVGDIIRIYKDGNLSQTVTIQTTNQSSPEISEKGDYTIEVTNVEGNVTTLHFVRQYTANAASSAFVIVVLAVIAIVLFIGLFSRKREKID